MYGIRSLRSAIGVSSQVSTHSSVPRYQKEKPGARWQSRHASRYVGSPLRQEQDAGARSSFQLRTCSTPRGRGIAYGTCARLYTPTHVRSGARARANCEHTYTVRRIGVHRPSRIHTRRTARTSSCYRDRVCAYYHPHAALWASVVNVARSPPCVCASSGICRPPTTEYVEPPQARTRSASRLTRARPTPELASPSHACTLPALAPAPVPAPAPLTPVAAPAASSAWAAAAAPGRRCRGGAAPAPATRRAAARSARAAAAGGRAAPALQGGRRRWP